MDDLSKKKLIIITYLLDIFLIGNIYFNKHTILDIMWTFSVIMCHGLFYYNLIYENRYILDILHYFIFILPTFALFTPNIYIKIISCLLLILIQILWIIEKRCILNEENYKFGYGDALNYYVIMLTSMLSLNIGYVFKN
jgi:hypothetical protein